MKPQPTDPRLRPTEIRIWHESTIGGWRWHWLPQGGFIPRGPFRTKVGAKRSARAWAKRSGLAIRITEP